MGVWLAETVNHIFIMTTFFNYMLQCIKIFLNGFNILLSYIYDDRLKIFETPIYLILYLIILGGILISHFGFDEVIPDD